MTIYRVFTSYHESSESGTHEYGYYSTLGAAKKRAKEVWAMEYAEYIPEELESGSLVSHTGWDSLSITVLAIKVDEDTENQVMGYT